MLSGVRMITVDSLLLCVLHWNFYVFISFFDERLGIWLCKIVIGGMGGLRIGPDILIGCDTAFTMAILASDEMIE